MKRGPGEIEGPDSKRVRGPLQPRSVQLARSPNIRELSKSKPLQEENYFKMQVEWECTILENILSDLWPIIEAYWIAYKRVQGILILHFFLGITGAHCCWLDKGSVKARYHYKSLFGSKGPPSNLRLPNDVAIDSSGRFYVPDTGMMTS